MKGGQKERREALSSAFKCSGDCLQEERKLDFTYGSMM